VAAALAAVQWPEGKPEEAKIACVECGALLDDGDRVDMIGRGEWRATAPFTGVAGFHIWEAYSPWRSLAEIVSDFLKAKPYPETLKAWINTSLGEPWEDQLGERMAVTRWRRALRSTSRGRSRRVRRSSWLAATSSMTGWR
jgi:phage terminase large subunit GpA-like protein